MLIGPMKHRVEIQSATQTQDDLGAVSYAWATDRKPWASIEPLQGDERMQVQQVKSSVSHKIVMRYDPTFVLTSEHRILYGTRVFEIDSVMNLKEQNETWVCYCVEHL